MSDFDFDELDKAVAGATSPDTAEEVVVAEPPTEQPSTEPASQPQVTDTPRAVPAARRSSGRFMDVVHPSSDMRTRTSPAVVEPKPSLNTEKTSFVPPVIKAEEDASQEPIDEVEEAFKQAEDGTVGEWSKPLETPFLADAKVEKRPLGGVGPEPSLVLLEAPEEELLLEEKTLPDPIDFAAHVAALKSETEDTGEPIPNTVEEPEAEEQTVKQMDELQEPEASTQPVMEVVKSEDKAEEPVGPASIPQQYNEQPAKQQESGAIFDTENYHQPLAPVAKKHSGVWTVIWILLLVILGAGAGVAFYLFVLPML